MLLLVENDKNHLQWELWKSNKNTDRFLFNKDGFEKLMSEWIDKVSEEQGEWAAETALEILAGKSPKEIPIVTNKEAKIYLNMPLAKRLGIQFPMELINSANFIGE